jgi:hypothetical protein
VTRQPDSDTPGVPMEVTPKPLTPGVTVGAGRYRLLERVGGDDRVNATFWRARDSVLDRDVALTTLTGPDGPRSIQAALATSRLEHPGIARILDVLRDSRQAGPGLSGVIVTEWIAGADLAALATDATTAEYSLSTGEIARTLSPLAGAVVAAHRAGFALGCDHPQKIRIGNNGLARLAYPVVPATGLQADDVRGLGAAIYLLITGCWPLPDPPVGLTVAPTGATGRAVSPRSLRPTASATLATLAERCLAGASANGVYAGAAVHQVLLQMSNVDADTTMVTPHTAVGLVSAVSADNRSKAPSPEANKPERTRRRTLVITLSVLGIAILALLGWLGKQVTNFIVDNPAGGGTTLVVPPPSESGPSQPGGNEPNPTPPPGPPPGPVQATRIEVYDLTGDPDNPNRVNRAIDGDPNSSWKTYDYNQPFPTLKAGVGLLVSFEEPVRLAAIQIDSPSAGSTVEIRTAPAGDAGLAGTAVLGTATLGDGRTEIRIDQPAPSQRILVWITGLGNRGGKNATELSELTFVRAG